MTEHEILGACPLDCPDTCSWVVTVRGRRGRQRCAATATTRTPRGALCAKVNGYARAHARARPARCTRCGASGRKGEGRFERISWDEALDEIAARLARRHRASTAARRSGRTTGTGTLGYLQGLEGRAGARLWNVLGASQHTADHLHDRGRRRRRRTRPAPPPAWTRRRSRDVQADPAVGHEPADQRPPHLEVHPGRAQQGRARRRDRPAPHPHGRARRRAPRAAARHRRRARARPAARGRRPGRRGPRLHRASTPRLGRVPRAHPGVPAGARRRRSPASPRSAIVALGERLATHAADRASACTHGHAAPRRRRHGACARSRASRASPGTGATRAAARPTPPAAASAANWPALCARRPAPAPGRARSTMTRLGEALLDVDDPPVQGARRLRRQPDGQQAGPGPGAARARARGPVHGGHGAVPDRHRRLRRHRAAGDDADRAPRRPRRLRAPVRAAQRAGGRRRRASACRRPRRSGGWRGAWA